MKEDYDRESKHNEARADQRAEKFAEHRAEASAEDELRRAELTRGVATRLRPAMRTEAELRHALAAVEMMHRLADGGEHKAAMVSAIGALEWALNEPGKMSVLFAECLRVGNEYIAKLK